MGVHTIRNHEHDWSDVEVHPYRTTFDHLNEKYAVEIRECLDPECDAKEWHRVEIGDGDTDHAPPANREGQQRLSDYDT